MIYSCRIFIKEQGGSVSIIAAVSVFLIIMIVGAGIDFGRAHLVQTKDQQASDAAALAAALILSKEKDSPEELFIRQTAAERYYKLNYPKSYLGVDRKLPEYNFANLEDIKLNNKNSLQTDYLKATGMNKIELSSNSTVNIPTVTMPDFDVAVVVDESGSTKDLPPGFAKSIIETEKDAITSMLSVLFPDGQAYNPNLRFGLVGYSSAIVHSLGLTADKKQAESYVKMLDYYSGTYSHWGLEAGFNMLSKNWLGFLPPYLCPIHSPGMACIPQNNTAAAAPITYRDDGKALSESRHLVFITDGYIMGQTAPCEYGIAAHKAYPDIDPETYLPGDTCPNYRLFNEICDKIKKAGITVYTINFYSQLESDVKPMKQCASNPDKYFFAPDTKTLKNILSGIATQIHKIRIVH